MTTDRSPVIPLERVAEMTNVPVATLRYWRHRHEGPRTFKLGRRVVAYQHDVEEWIAAQAAGASASGGAA